MSPADRVIEWRIECATCPDHRILLIASRWGVMLIDIIRDATGIHSSGKAAQSPQRLAAWARNRAPLIPYFDEAWAAHMRLAIEAVAEGAGVPS